MQETKNIPNQLLNPTPFAGVQDNYSSSPFLPPCTQFLR